ncbi:glycosyltransferase family 4 protein [Pleurocapsa sp. PCC 7319]|uniref:glycosyltransferase family 4 protein n=1 Tax=Pleurocapsa sp. PCC 7319 TaxID=118161 RepID=UPI00034C4341|nr:glycosyltransferase family 4 protein [Pleurocapsa sp. PCC 7319]
MKITLVISSLGCGGGERAIVLLAEGLANLKHQVTLITLADKSTDFYQLSSKVSRLDLGIMGKSSSIVEALANNIRRLSTLRKAIESTKPDVVVSSLRITNVSVILALLGKKYPVIVTEQNDVKVFSYGLVWETLRRLTYPLCSKVVSVSQGVDLGIDLLPSNKRAVIYNPITIKDDQTTPPLPPEVDSNKNWIASMGRLTDQKGHDLLLQAFHKIADKHSNWQLLILGRGELGEQLEKMRDELGLSGQVIFTDALSNPFAVLKKAKLFVMASRNEGFPLAHGEALACGLPVIATDCPSGPREMIRHEIDGLLVDNYDIDGLAAAMNYLMSDEQERKRLAAKASEVVERFGQDKIVAEWETLIQKVVGGKN